MTMATTDGRAAAALPASGSRNRAQVDGAQAGQPPAPAGRAGDALAGGPAPVTGVRGLVVTADHWPLPGAAVTVVGPAGRQLGRATADESGAFTVSTTAAGPVTVIFAAAGVDPTARTMTLGPRQVTDLGAVILDTPRRTAAPEPGRWDIDPAHSIVRATARHLAMSHVEGRFTAFTGFITLADPVERSSVQVRIDAASIDTGNAERDAHLRSPDFLDVARFPELTYRSSRIVPLGGDRYVIEGQLTIRDITRDVPLDASYLGSAPDPWGGVRIGVVASTQLARRDFEINWNMGLPGGLVLVGPTLRIDLAVQAVRSAAA
jgi:polyisoprenoid-binding protein YceI